MDTASCEIELSVNGQHYKRQAEPRTLLADFLRHEIGLKGTHIGCAHGVCGACTVQIDGKSARSCLHFAIDVQGCEIKTVESLASAHKLHPIQQAFHENHALQCGYCTPGFLMTVEEFLRTNPDPSDEEIRIALANNICRCTGYVNIVKAVAAAAQKLRQGKS
ncbi:MAG: carbon monoxide dehydrogenase small chain [Paucimonas sp.]|jgi:aerobic-type carbon monoxide dehydrogenase small subunit (CoxS/CutS family)|nr:carbon monoxide dehydrogenase small chain [Paucimonas sp.]